MALQVSGTTVVNNSRQLQNIASLDNTTTNTIAAAAGGVDYSSPTYASASSGTNNVLFTAGSGGAFGFWWLYFNHNAGSGNLNVTGSGSYIGRTGTGTYSNIGSAKTQHSLSALQVASGIWRLGSGGTIRFTVNSSNRGTGSIMGYQL